MDLVAFARQQDECRGAVTAAEGVVKAVHDHSCVIELLHALTSREWPQGGNHPLRKVRH